MLCRALAAFSLLENPFGSGLVRDSVDGNNFVQVGNCDPIKCFSSSQQSFSFLCLVRDFVDATTSSTYDKHSQRQIFLGWPFSFQSNACLVWTATTSSRWDSILWKVSLLSKVSHYAFSCGTPWTATTSSRWELLPNKVRILLKKNSLFHCVQDSVRRQQRRPGGTVF